RHDLEEKILRSPLEIENQEHIFAILLASKNKICLRRLRYQRPLQKNILHRWIVNPVANIQPCVRQRQDKWDLVLPVEAPLKSAIAWPGRKAFFRNAVRTTLDRPNSGESLRRHGHKLHQQ